jgi:hypothetical protein
MNLRIRFLDFSRDIAGSPVQLFRMTQTGPIVAPVLIGQTIVQDLEAVFDIGEGTGEFAVRLNATTGTRFRSRLLSFQQQVDEGADEAVIAFVLQEPMPSPMVLTPAQVTGSLPPLPFTDGAVMITTLTLTLGAGMITVTGSATHTATVTVSDPFGFGVSTTFTKSTPVTFTASFTLAPVTGVPTGERLIRVTLGPLTVTAAHGGLLGPLADIITNVIIFFLDGTIREQIEDSIQAQIDAAVANAMGENVPASATVTVQSLAIAPAGLTLTPVAGVPGADVCPGEVASGSVRWRARAQQDHLRILRDKLIARSPLGVTYLDALKRHQAEIILLLLRNPDCLKAMDAAVKAVLAEFPARNPEKGRLSKKAAAAIEQFLRMAEKAASPKLAAVAAALRNDLPKFIETDVTKTLFEGWQAQKAKKVAKTAKSKKK